ncbi:PREDICTED: uncharacterized protein LOC105503300 [Colobus angolensis palliatus]|uniref:uncharacterized protein LOC105503300 n=1 Tax=Colobus angolensis palliatus TaxID=336983 RepID=UPI0005F4150D|nr:PREDICTED: uncharacterized protein LOC105503300 [Colobus angolensis palliatus]
MELQYPPPPPSPRICRERSGRDNTSMPVLSEDSGLHETLALLTSQLRPDSNHKEEMGFLRDVFSEKSLSYLMKIHEKLRYYERQSPTPFLHSAVALAEDVMEELQAASVHSDERELLQLLSTPHLRAVLMVHDTVAQKNFDAVLPPLPDNIDEDFDEESVKIVRLVKNKEPLPCGQQVKTSFSLDFLMCSTFCFVESRFKDWFDAADGRLSHWPWLQLCYLPADLGVSCPTSSSLWLIRSLRFSRRIQSQHLESSVGLGNGRESGQLAAWSLVQWGLEVSPGTLLWPPRTQTVPALRGHLWGSVCQHLCPELSSPVCPCQTQSVWLQTDEWCRRFQLLSVIFTWTGRVPGGTHVQGRASELHGPAQEAVPFSAPARPSKSLSALSASAVIPLPAVDKRPPGWRDGDTAPWRKRWPGTRFLIKSCHKDAYENV